MNATSNEQVICIQFGACRVRIACDSVPLHTILADHFRHCRCMDAPDTSSEVDYRITTRGSVYDLWRDGLAPLNGLSRDQLLVTLMDALVTRLIEPCADRLLFHAAGVALDGQGVLLCGASGSGKSTLTASLIRRDFDYLTDEVTAVPLNSLDDTPCMTGLPRSLVLKPGSASVWRTEGDIRGQTYDFADGSAWVSPDSFRVNCLRSEASPRLAILPRYEANAGFTVQQLSQAQAAFALMQHLVNARNLPQHGLSAAARLAVLLTAFSIVYSDVELVRQWLKEHLAAGLDQETIIPPETPHEYVPSAD